MICAQLQEFISTFNAVESGLFTEDDMKWVQEQWGLRWEMMHSPLHCLAYALDPEYLDHDDMLGDRHISEGVNAALKIMAPNTYVQCLQQLRGFRNKTGIFGEDTVKAAAKQMGAHAFWECCGASMPELRAVAMRALSQTCSSSTAERNWSSYEFVHSKKRNRLNAERCNDLIYVFTNLRLVERLRSDAYDEQVVEWESDESDSEAQEPVDLAEDEDQPEPELGWDRNDYNDGGLRDQGVDEDEHRPLPLVNASVPCKRTGTGTSKEKKVMKRRKRVV